MPSSIYRNTEISASGEPFTITPHDSNAITANCKAIFVGTGGNVTLRGKRGNADVVFKNVQDGQVLDVDPGFIRATGTTASDIVGLG